jgi:hypothetical protein
MVFGAHREQFHGIFPRERIDRSAQRKRGNRGELKRDGTSLAAKGNAMRSTGEVLLKI